MNSEQKHCQYVYPQLVYSSSKVLEPMKLMQLRWYIKNHGWQIVFRKIAENLGLKKSIRSGVGDLPKGQKSPFEDVLDLQPGEKVEVRSKEEILQTLNKSGEYKGLAFSFEMWDFCGKQFTVFKRVNRIVLESTGEFRKVKNTVLLTDVFCDGSKHYNCDRACFHFWRETWLKRVNVEASK